jgi:hypothetical protein
MTSQNAIEKWFLGNPKRMDVIICGQIFGGKQIGRAHV